jgi:hypothetical protein
MRIPAESLARTAFCYLAVGLVASIVVAWALALLPTQYGGPTIHTSRNAPLWQYHVHQSWPGSFRAQYRALNFPEFWGDQGSSGIPSWSPAAHTKPTNFDRISGMAIDDARGFPFLALRCSWTSTPQGYVLEGGIPLKPWNISYNDANTEAPRALPLMPIWMGLAANTVVIAVGLAAAPALVRAWRRRIRRSRGGCSECGYSKLCVGRCPECGSMNPST